MAVAWAFLLWADWEFYENSFRHSGIEGRLVFALVATVCCFACTVALARAEELQYLNSNLDKLCIGALSLIVAFAWEETFDEALEVAVEDVAHPAVAKILLANLVGATVLP